jgi:hypothetical protein
MEIACQRCESSVISEPLKKLADVGDPEGSLKARADLAETSRKSQQSLLNPELGFNEHNLVLNSTRVQQP